MLKNICIYVSIFKNSNSKMSPNINQNNFNFIEVTDYAENIFNIIDDINQNNLNQTNIVLSFANVDILHNEANTLQRIKSWIHCYLPTIINESKFDRFNLIHIQLDELTYFIGGIMESSDLTEQKQIIAENLIEKIDEAQEVLLEILYDDVQQFHFHLKLEEALSCLV